MAWQRMIGLLAVAALALVGCQQQQTVDASSGAPRLVQPVSEMVAQAGSPIPDVPIPMGFKLDASKSQSDSAAGVRFMDHVYTGRAEVNDVERFFKRQLPVNRWTLVMERYIRGYTVVFFEKDTERLRIQISGNFWSTTVEVQLWTSGRIQNPSGPLK